MAPFQKYTGILPLAFWSKITSGLVTLGRLLQFPMDLSIFLSKPFVSADPITSSSYVYTNPESTKPDFFSPWHLSFVMICSKWIFIEESNKKLLFLSKRQNFLAKNQLKIENSGFVKTFDEHELWALCCLARSSNSFNLRSKVESFHAKDSFGSISVASWKEWKGTGFNTLFPW